MNIYGCIMETNISYEMCVYCWILSHSCTGITTKKLLFATKFSNGQEKLSKENFFFNCKYFLSKISCQILKHLRRKKFLHKNTYNSIINVIYFQGICTCHTSFFDQRKMFVTNKILFTIEGMYYCQFLF